MHLRGAARCGDGSGRVGPRLSCPGPSGPALCVEDVAGVVAPEGRREASVETEPPGGSGRTQMPGGGRTGSPVQLFVN